MIAPRDENCWKHGQHASGTKQIKMRNQRDMAYLEIEIVDNACTNHQKGTLVNAIFHQLTVD